MVLGLSSQMGYGEPEPDIWSRLPVAIGIKGLSQLEKRGVIYYPAWQVQPVFSVNLGSPNLQLIGTELHMKKDLHEYLRIRGIADINVLPEALYETESEEVVELEQEQSHEFIGQVEFTPSPYFEIYGSVAQDLKAHWGRFYTLTLQSVLASFQTKTPLQINFYFQGGSGDRRANDYFYAYSPGTVFSYYHAGLSLTAEPVIDKYFPVIRLYLSELTFGQEVNRDPIFEFIVAKRIF